MVEFDTPAAPVIATVCPDALPGLMPELAAILHACVHGGASVNFVVPFSLDDAAAFWRDRVLPAARAGTRVVLMASVDSRPAGTVMLDTATPPNQPHRADVTKLLVHPAHRRRGIARALMLALEDQARARGRRLITLDTKTGDAAERLYRALGYRMVGTIPGYSLDPGGSGRLDSTSLLYKTL